MAPFRVSVRKSKGGKSKRRFSEGWVEMEKKSVAKQIAAALNNTRIGYRKRSPLYDSLWSLKYLSG
jgi:ESF2/ABP1 family protein